jgi:hypothetical protein
MRLSLFYRQLLLLPAALLGSLTARAQPDPIKFGKVEPKEFSAAAFVADSAAAAVVLCDFGQTRFQLNGTEFQLVTERITRIKILKKSGYDAATVKIPLYHQAGNEEKLTGLRGFTYNMVSGVPQKSKLETNAVFTEELNKNIRLRKFTLPDVREGSVIEYSYTVTSDYYFNFQSWTFQQEMPVRWSEYRAAIPEFFDYKMVMQGYLPTDVQERQENTAQYRLHLDAHIDPGMSNNSGRTAAVNENIDARVTNYRWVMKNVPAFVEEPYMTTSEDFVARLNFELAGTKMPGSPYKPVANNWEKISSELLSDESFGLQLNRGGFLKEQMQALAAQYPEVPARTAAVRQAVMSAVRYDGTNRYAAPNSLRKAYDAHRGTSAEVNLLLIAALRNAGIMAHPVLLSTRSHGQVSEAFVMLEKFNYVVALVPLSDGKELLADATDPTLPCGMLPQRCLNQLGRLIAPKPEDGRWISLLPSQRHTHYQQVQLTLDAQGGLSGKVHEEHGGYAGAAARDELTEMGEKKYWAELARQHSSWSLPKTIISQRDDPAKPLALDYEFTQPAEESSTPGTLYLSPLSHFVDEQNPFHHGSRLFPVDFGMPQDETTTLSLTLPAGYELAEIPKTAVVDLADNGGRFLYNVTAEGSTVQITSRMNLRKPVYAADEYEHLREFYRLMLAKQTEKLVIKKKA